MLGIDASFCLSSIIIDNLTDVSDSYPSLRITTVGDSDSKLRSRVPVLERSSWWL